MSTLGSRLLYRGETVDLRAEAGVLRAQDDAATATQLEQRAAQLLGISRRTLERRVAEWGHGGT